jgi:type IV pilus assembly protein PilQ
MRNNALNITTGWPRMMRRLVFPVLLAGLVACQHESVPTHRAGVTPGKEDSSQSAKTGQSASKKTAAVEASPQADSGAGNASDVSTAVPMSKPAATNKVVRSKSSGSSAVSSEYDAELRSIIDLARRNKWEEAESRISALYAADPRDSSVERVYNWVKTEGPKRREKALEDKIRNVNAKDSRFNPTLWSVLSESKNKGLPPRSDLREAIENIKATPYIPEAFGKTIQAKGPAEDFNTDKGKMAAILDKEIEVHLDNVTLENIVFNVGQSEGINFIADKSIPAFQQKLSVNMKNVKLSEFLNYVSRNMGVQFQVGGDLIWIVDGKDTNKVQMETRFYRLRKGLILPAQFGISDAVKTTVTANNITTATEVQKYENFVRDGASKEPSIESAIRMFCHGLKYQIDLERNVIVARGTQQQLEVLEKIIKEFDKPIQQVLIEARFITVEEPMFLQLGVAWETGRNSADTSRTATDYTGLASNVGLGYQESWYGVLGRASLSATLSAIDQSGESEVLSAPRVTLINNLPATISDGKIQYFYEQYTVTQQILANRSVSSLVPQGKPTKLTSGVTLDVLASVGGDGRSVMLALRPKVAQDVKLITFATITDRDDSGNISSTFDIKLPEKSEQSLATRVVVKSGQTVVMGGVSQREQRTFVESVPVLGNIPFIGAAFRRRTEIDNPRYLLIFVTATLLSENGEYMVNADAE